MAQKTKHLVVLPYGWVLVGTYSAKTATIKGAVVARIWGTKKGLGELAEGPLPNTVVDLLGDVTHVTAPLFVLPVRGW